MTKEDQPKEHKVGAASMDPSASIPWTAASAATRTETETFETSLPTPTPFTNPKYLVPLEIPCVYFDSNFLGTIFGEGGNGGNCGKNDNINETETKHCENVNAEAEVGTGTGTGTSIAKSKELLDHYYQDLLHSIKWQKTSKINRWVSLHHELADDTRNHLANEVQDPTVDIDNKNKHADAHDINNNDTNKGATSTAAIATASANTDKSELAASSAADVDYKYRDAPAAAHVGFTKTIQEIKRHVETWYAKVAKNTNTGDGAEGDGKVNVPNFNVCLLNYYENGHQRIGWHSDREEIGRIPPTPIVSISLGTTRQFLIRSKSNGVQDRANLSVTHGSIIIMENICQYHYLHSIPKETDVTDGRINLTFRCKRQQHEQVQGEQPSNPTAAAPAAPRTTTPGEEEHQRRDQWLSRLTDGVTPSPQGWSINDGIIAGGDSSNTDDQSQLQERGQRLMLSQMQTQLQQRSSSKSAIVFGQDVLIGNCDDVDRAATADDEMKMHIDYLVTTNLGAESYCAAEIQEKLSLLSPMMPPASLPLPTEQSAMLREYYHVVARPLNMDGCVALVPTSSSPFTFGAKKSGDENNEHKHQDVQRFHSTVQSMLLSLKSAHYILAYHFHFTFADVAQAASKDWRKSSTTVDTSDKQNTNSVEEEKNDKEIKRNVGTTIETNNGQIVTNEESLTPQKITGEDLYQYCKQLLVQGKASIPSLEAPSQPMGNDTRGKDEASSKAIAKTTTTTFRVTCDRIGGPHAFQTPDVEYEMGGAMFEYFNDKYKAQADKQNQQQQHKIKPKMSDYDVNVRVMIIGHSQIIVATQLNVHDLSKERHFLKFRNAVTIKTNLAYAMVRLANIDTARRKYGTSTNDNSSNDRVVVADPFCGSGTLLLEALEVYNSPATPPTSLVSNSQDQRTERTKLYCVGMDVSRRSADGARENALAENYGADDCKFVCCDARGLRKHLDDNSVDAMVTNLPWGIMTGHSNGNDSLQTMYEIFLRTSWYVLKDGARIVMLVLRGLQIVRMIRKLSGRYKLLHVNVVRTTNNLPCVVVVEKLPADVLVDNIKGQLAYMNQYVNVSPEIYQAIHMEDIVDDDHHR